MTKQEIVKDFQKWAITQQYSWSGAADPWIGAYYYYDIENLLKKIKLLEEENKILKESTNEHRDNK